MKFGGVLRRVAGSLGAGIRKSGVILQIMGFEV
jgi:hypothetical protein